ncbi:MAG: DUF86 domain-containing protein [Gammaproteobacteria bacterium]|nr:DUF86 domain-containing protein [Gammaproteobacteria bacterium]
MNDVVANKIQSLQRCIGRVREEFEHSGRNLGSDISRQDAAILNITRACEVAIDLANYTVKLRKLGIPNDSRESFQLLEDAGLISSAMSLRLQSMVGFRNVAVHDYRRLDLDIVHRIIEQDLDELLAFAEGVRTL